MPHIYAENPFCSRRIKPGAIPFFFPEGLNEEILVERLRENEWYGQIIGPHGSGKSTLLAALLPALENEGRHLLHLELQDGTRHLPLTPEQLEKLDKNSLLAIDGYEQLSYWSRRRLKNKSKIQGFGTLIIAHAPFDLPILFRTHGNLEVAQQIVKDLLLGTPVHISESLVEERFYEQKGNVREMLFSLYDDYEMEYRRIVSHNSEK
ncbi:MAG: hypothetical protein Q4C96_04930 [Planctomycetia bacterium]|nr:hypothetical protein [Planctomycetia bacterium]